MAQSISERADKFATAFLKRRDSQKEEPAIVSRDEAFATEVAPLLQRITQLRKQLKG